MVGGVDTLANNAKGVEFLDRSSTYPTSKSLLHSTLESKDSDSGRRLGDIGKLMQRQVMTRLAYKLDVYWDLAKCDPRDSDAELNEWLVLGKVRSETYSIVIPRANHTSCPLSRILPLECHSLYLASFILPRITNTQVICSGSASTRPCFGAYLLPHQASR